METPDVNKISQKLMRSVEVSTSEFLYSVRRHAREPPWNKFLKGASEKSRDFVSAAHVTRNRTNQRPSLLAQQLKCSFCQSAMPEHEVCRQKGLVSLPPRTRTIPLPNIKRPTRTAR